MACRLLNLLPDIVVAVKVEDIGDHVQRILVVLDFGLQAGQVEAVRQVLLVDFAEVLMAASCNKPVAPVRRVVGIGFGVVIVHYGVTSKLQLPRPQVLIRGGLGLLVWMELQLVVRCRVKRSYDRCQ